VVHVQLRGVRVERAVVARIQGAIAIQVAVVAWVAGVPEAVQVRVNLTEVGLERAIVVHIQVTVAIEVRIAWHTVMWIAARTLAERRPASARESKDPHSQHYDQRY
jgi:hypothetical protein